MVSKWCQRGAGLSPSTVSDPTLPIEASARARGRALAKAAETRMIEADATEPRSFSHARHARAVSFPSVFLCLCYWWRQAVSNTCAPVLFSFFPFCFPWTPEANLRIPGFRAPAKEENVHTPGASQAAWRVSAIGLVVLEFVRTGQFLRRDQAAKTSVAPF